MNVEPHQKREEPAYPSACSSLAVRVAALAVMSGIGVSCEQQRTLGVPFPNPPIVKHHKDSSKAPSSND